MRKNRLRRPPRPFNGLRYVRFLLVMAVIAGLYGYLRDLKAPVIEVLPAQGMLSAQRPLTIKVSDSGSGLKSLRIIARQGGSETVLTQKEFSGEKSSEIHLDLGKTGLNDGSVEFGFEVRDHSIFP
ncbi:MAG: hypothetical protein EHM37_11940, partial [Deltaproteobacteria bacterium]